MFEGTWQGVICLFMCVCRMGGGGICANVSSCVHSLVVTAGFPGWRRGKPSRLTNKQAAFEGKLFTRAKTYWAPQILQRRGGVCHFSVFGKLSRPCWKKVFWLHQLPSWNAPDCDKETLLSRVKFTQNHKRNLKVIPSIALADTQTHRRRLPSIN